MKPHILASDYELISAYLDGVLESQDKIRFEQRLEKETSLLSIYKETQQTRYILKQLPALRAPRSFTLTQGMVKERHFSSLNYFPLIALRIFQFSAVLSILLLFIVLLGDLFFPLQMTSEVGLAPRLLSTGASLPSLESKKEKVPAAPLPDAAKPQTTSLPLPTESIAKDMPAQPPPAPMQAAKEEAPAAGEVTSNMAPEAVFTSTILPTSPPISETIEAKTRPTIIPNSPSGIERGLLHLGLVISLAFCAVLSGGLAWFIARSFLRPK